MLSSIAIMAAAVAGAAAWPAYNSSSPVTSPVVTAPVAYVTDVVYTTTTFCPAGETVTFNDETITITEATTITTVCTTASTIGKLPAANATVYATDLQTSYTTVCPAGQTVTVSGTPTTYPYETTLTLPAYTQVATMQPNATIPVVYTTDVTSVYVTTCPAGQPITTEGSVTSYSTPTVISLTTTSKATMTTYSSVSATATVTKVAPSGNAAVGPTASSTVAPFTGAASKTVAGFSGIVGAVVALFML